MKTPSSATKIDELGAVDVEFEPIPALANFEAASPLAVISSIAPLVERARAALARAETAAEVLDARDEAALAYDAVKRAARLARAKSAADEVIAAAYRLQADALDIEAAAKRRLADEYDAAQERGEVQKPGGDRVSSNVPDQNNALPTVTDLGITRKAIHEARQLRDAEHEEPGFTRRVLDDALARGEEPTRAAVMREADAKRRPHVLINTGCVEWYSPAAIVEAARRVLGGIDLDPASCEIANLTVKAKQYFTAEDDGLQQEWPIGRVWLNPPFAKGLVDRFAERLVAEVRRGSTAITITNHATETQWFQGLAAECSAICLVRGRVRFTRQAGDASGSPSCGQVVCYFGPDIDAFAREVGPMGVIFRPMRPAEG